MIPVDRETWPRKAIYDFFSPMSNPFYALTFPVDVTALRCFAKERGLSFYCGMVWMVTRAMDQVEAFRYKIRGEEIILHNHLIPSFTDLAPGSDTFHITTLEAGNDLEAFCGRARAASQAQTEFMTRGPWPEDQLVYFTCLPWFPLTALTNERDTDPSDSIPRVGWGRWEEAGERTVLHLSLELNHRLLDGVHAGRFYETLCRDMGRLEALL